MATKLKNMKLTSVDLVRAGANQEADICLYKSADGVESREEGIFKRFLHWLRNENQEEPVEKARVTFDQITEGREKQEKLWQYTSALTDSIVSIRDDGELDNAGKASMMRESLGQFNAAMEQLIGELCRVEEVFPSPVAAIGKSDPDRFDEIEEVQKFNPYHGKDGRFASADGAASFTYMPGKNKAHDKAIRREMVRDECSRFGNADAKTFSEAVEKARASCDEKDRWRVTAHTQKELEEEYPGAKLHVTRGGSTVAVTKSGDIISVCHADGDVLRGSDLMEIAVKNGGKKLDSFSGNHGFYDRMGFEAVSWTPFNETYAPDGWNKSIHRPEEVVAYKYVGKRPGIKLETFIDKVKPFKGEDGYDNMIRARDQSMEG